MPSALPAIFVGRDCPAGSPLLTAAVADCYLTYLALLRGKLCSSLSVSLSLSLRRRYAASPIDPPPLHPHFRGAAVQCEASKEGHVVRMRVNCLC